MQGLGNYRSLEVSDSEKVSAEVKLCDVLAQDVLFEHSVDWQLTRKDQGGRC